MGVYTFEGAIGSDWTWQEFGRELILSQDLDPLYVMLAEAQPIMGDDMLKRFLLAYGCYYHTGTAAYISEAPGYSFYDLMWEAIEERYPRGMERRHFWGKTAENTVTHLESLGSPEAIIDNISFGGTFREVSNRTQELVGFGPWMGWKMADLVDRVLAVPVDFSDSVWGIVPDPVKGAALIAYGDWRHDITLETVQQIVDDICSELDDLEAPPYYDRLINIQEAETILCNFKAHHKGFYPLGNDTYHMTEALNGWGDLAEELKNHLPSLDRRWLDDSGKVAFITMEDYYG